MRPFSLTLAALSVAILAGSSGVRADTYLLTQGGQVVGELQNPDELPRQNYVVKTAEGAVITLAKSQVQQVVRHAEPMTVLHV